MWNPILHSVLVFLWLECMFELYIHYQQHQMYKKCIEVPTELREYLEEQTFEKIRLQCLDKSRFKIVRIFLSQIFACVMLLNNGHAYLWESSGTILSLIHVDAGEGIWKSVTFTILLIGVYTLFDLPFRLYYTFAIEASHGFVDNQTPHLFIGHMVEKYLYEAIVAFPGAAGITYFMNRIGENYNPSSFFLTFWAVALLIGAFRNYIVPLFYKFNLLDDEILKLEIENLASSVSFPLKSICVSKDRSYRMPYICGSLNKKIIVLNNSILDENVEEDVNANPLDDYLQPQPKRCTNSEILALISHELGHWNFDHEKMYLAFSSLHLLIVSGALSFLIYYQPFYQAFGFLESQPRFVGFFIITSFFLGPHNAIFDFFYNIITHYFEFEADRYACELRYADELKSAIVKLKLKDKEFPVHHWLYSIWRYDRPTVLERLIAISKLD